MFKTRFAIWIAATEFYQNNLYWTAGDQNQIVKRDLVPLCTFMLRAKLKLFYVQTINSALWILFSYLECNVCRCGAFNIVNACINDFCKLCDYKRLALLYQEERKYALRIYMQQYDTYFPSNSIFCKYEIFNLVFT